LVGQEILNGKYFIHLIQQNLDDQTIRIWIQRKDEILLWKEFSSHVPVSIEYNINF
jgi:hypothetical protein